MNKKLATEVKQGEILGRINSAYILWKIGEEYYLINRGQHLITLFFPQLSWKLEYQLFKISNEVEKNIFNEDTHRGKVGGKSSFLGFGVSSLFVVIVRPYLNSFRTFFIANLFILLIGFVIIMRMTVFSKRATEAVSSSFLIEKKAICQPEKRSIGLTFVYLLFGGLFLFTLVAAVVSNNILLSIGNFLFFYLYIDMTGYKGVPGNYRIHFQD